MITKEEVKKLIKQGLPDAEVIVRNDYDDGEHFDAEVASAEFVGLNLVKQHQVVYRALGDAMHGRIHALALRTYTLEAWPHK